MSEERHNESLQERESQLSAMFDGELPSAECELLARRLTRDELLRAQWSRFSMIGAALRAERGVALHDRVAWRVQSVIAQEATYGDGSVDSAATTRTSVIVPANELKAASAARWWRFARPAAGAGIAAGVAAMSIFWLRTQDDSQTLLAAAPMTDVPFQTGVRSENGRPTVFCWTKGPPFTERTGITLTSPSGLPFAVTWPERT